jgi:hypothetical protein
VKTVIYLRVLCKKKKKKEEEEEEEEEELFHRLNDIQLLKRDLLYGVSFCPCFGICDFSN